MKRFGKFLSLALALIMAMSVSVTALAATITVDSAAEGETYKAYKIFDVTVSGSSDDITYAYTIDKKTGIDTGAEDNPWFSIVKNYKVTKSDVRNGTGEQELTVFDLEPSTVDTNKYVVTINTYTNRDGKEVSLFQEEADVASFAEYLRAQLSLETTPPPSVTAEEIASKGQDGTVSAEFENLVPGYYFVTTSLGSLCVLNTSTDALIINEKNTIPTLEKKILVMKTVGGEEKEVKVSNTSASIGDTIKYQITVTNGKGTNQPITVHDVMENGLTLSMDNGTALSRSDFTVEVKNRDGDTKEDVITESNWSAGTGTETGDDATPCTFEIEFKEDFVKKLSEGDKIIITYFAELNQNAEIASGTNDNTAWLTYSEQESKESTVTVSTYKFDLVKTGEKTSSGSETYTVLDGAEFELYDAETGGNKIELVKESDESYRVATSEEKAEEGFTSPVIKAGETTIKGLGSGTYYLKETKAPDGYNGLTSREKVTIDNANLENSPADPSTDEGAGSKIYTRGSDTGVQIINKTGSVLPSTGGIGTTIFYILGAVLVVGSGVLLVVRKRMKDEE